MNSEGFIESLGEPFVFEFLENDTIRVKNTRGIALTFSISPKMSISRHDKMMENIDLFNFRELPLVLHWPAGYQYEKDTGTPNDLIDSPLTPEILKDVFNITPPEFRLMYEMARMEMVKSYKKRKPTKSE